MSSNPQPSSQLFSAILIGGLFLIPVFWVISLINGVEPFACPPGTKTITSPTSFEKWCVEI